MKKSRHIILALLTASFILPAIAEEQPIIVTATRTAQTADESLASVTIISKEQIEQLQPNNILDLLSATAGMDITNQGGNGKITSLFLRGTSSSHVLVMVDGVKIGSATSGTTAFEHIPVSQIEHIEIVRGPRSSLYGSEAIGGVIQIFTHKGTKNDIANFEIKYGSYQTKNISAGLSGVSGNTSYSLNANHFKTDGFDAVNDAETDNDGYNNDSVSLNLSHSFGKDTSLALNFMQADGHVDYDGASQNNSDILQQSTGLKLTFNPTKSWNSILSTSQSLDKNDSFNKNVFSSKFNTKKTNISWQNDLILSTNQIFTIGLDNQNDWIESSTNYVKTSRDNTAGFVQHQWNGDANDVQLSLRNDDNEAFGSHTTGGLSWGHDFESNLRLIASYGTAFKSPTFNELYYPGGGNANLKPEESTSTELELRKKHTWGKWSFNVFNTSIKNLISGWPTKNVNKAEINGVELRLNSNILGFDTMVDLSLLDPRDKTTNKILQRRSQELLRINIDKETGKWKTGVSIISQGHRYNDTANNTRIDGYTIMNLQTQYKVSKKITLKGKIENIFDKEYTTASDFSQNAYNNPRRSVFVSLQYRDF